MCVCVYVYVYVCVLMRMRVCDCVCSRRVGGGRGLGGLSAVAERGQHTAAT